jgi:hypothetical protein
MPPGGPNDWSRIADLLGVAEISRAAHDREVTTLTRARAAVLAAGLLLGCSPGGEDATERRSDPGPEVVQPTTRPHFRGDLAVTLATGRSLYGEAACPGEPDDDRVCDPAENREYLVLGRTSRVRLVEARMDLADGNTSWTATVTFAADSTRDLVAHRELARESGAVVLVLDGTDEVLLVAPVTRIEGRRITYPLLAKPDAWDLVERIAGG